MLAFTFRINIYIYIYIQNLFYTFKKKAIKYIYSSLIIKKHIIIILYLHHIIMLLASMNFGMKNYFNMFVKDCLGLNVF